MNKFQTEHYAHLSLSSAALEASSSFSVAVCRRSSDLSKSSSSSWMRRFRPAKSLSSYNRKVQTAVLELGLVVVCFKNDSLVSFQRKCVHVYVHAHFICMGSVETQACHFASTTHSNYNSRFKVLLSYLTKLFETYDMAFTITKCTNCKTINQQKPNNVWKKTKINVVVIKLKLTIDTLVVKCLI